MTDCRHDRITTYFQEDGTGRMWACASPDCRIRFYPACPVCISVGHRNEEHPDKYVPLEDEPEVPSGGPD